MGRPSKFKPEYVTQAAKLCLLGATDAQIADFFDVNEDTINEWKKKHSKFSESLKSKDVADGQVERSLFQRANGYSHDAVKIFANKFGEVIEAPYIERYPPDTTACIFWLKNRQPKRWRDKQDIELSGDPDKPISFVSEKPLTPTQFLEQYAPELEDDGEES